MQYFISIFMLHSVIILISFLVCCTLNGLTLCHGVIKVGCFILCQWKMNKQEFM